MTNLVTIPDLTNDIDRDFARRAYHAISFSPEKRGDAMIASYQTDVKDLAELVEKLATHDRHKEIAQEVFDYYHEGIKKRYIAWISAKSRCMSSMITGPANFPVAKAEKANRSEHKRCTELIDYIKKLETNIKKKFNGVFTNQEKQVSEIDQLKTKLKNAEERQELMKLANKAYKSFKKDAESKKTKELMDQLPEKVAEEVKNYVPTYSWEPNPFAPYQLSNNNANIKRMKERLAVLEKKQEKAEAGETNKIELNGLTVLQNYEEDRLQLIFEGKPDADVRSILKSHGFRWAPSQGAWQRKNTNNAVYVTKNHVLKSEPFQQFTKEG